MTDLRTSLGGHELRTPLIGACGTVGSVVDFARTVAFEAYGAAVAKSVSVVPWEGRQPPRMAPAGEGMLNGIGIQNPGVAAWSREYGPQLAALGVEVWGSAVGHRVAEFAAVAAGLEEAGVRAIEVNLSCPNLDGGPMYALDARLAAAVIADVVASVAVPVGAKLSPNAIDVVEIADAVAGAGASWVVLGNTVWGAGFDVETRRPKLSGVVGGYSGAPLKPISLRCVWEVSQALPDLPIVGCGGVRTGEDVVEYLLAGASAVAVGTAHFAEPRVGPKLLEGVQAYCERHGVTEVTELVGAAIPW
ncbi:MAG TPA: dihydroorotate dehydrogenase [Acidimicrobiia bacterium]|nr:dihydroorotate dehydrogenase [Acidimicrobiia bacterium]